LSISAILPEHLRNQKLSLFESFLEKMLPIWQVSGVARFMAFRHRQLLPCKFLFDHKRLLCHYVYTIHFGEGSYFSGIFDSLRLFKENAAPANFLHLHPAVGRKSALIQEYTP